MADRCRINFFEEQTRRFFYTGIWPYVGDTLILRTDVQDLSFADTGLQPPDLGYWYMAISGTHDGKYLLLGEAANGQHGSNDHLDWIYNTETQALSLLRVHDYPSGIGGIHSSEVRGQFIKVQYGYLGADKIVIYDYPEWTVSAATADQPGILLYSLAIHPSGEDLIVCEGGVNPRTLHYSWSAGLNKWVYQSDLFVGVPTNDACEFSPSGDKLVLLGDGIEVLAWPSKTRLFMDLNPDYQVWSQDCLVWSDDEQYLVYSHQWTDIYESITVFNTTTWAVIPPDPSVQKEWGDRMSIFKSGPNKFVAMVWDWEDDPEYRRCWAEFSIFPYAFIRKGTQHIDDYRDDLASCIWGVA
jgi:hypothetical protein